VGVRNKERRQAKAKDRQRRARGRSTAGYYAHGHHSARCPDCETISPRDAVALLVMSASVTCRHDVPAATDPTVCRLAELYDSDDELAGHIDTALICLLNEQITGVWRDGWQPSDIVGALRRNTTELTAVMAADSMAAHLTAFQPTTVDECFPAQLAALRADRDGGAVSGFVRRWAHRAGADTVTAVATAFELADALGHLPELPQLCPPPGHASRAPQPPSNGRTDPKLLERVRALLAKAESSEYGAEADSLTAKAQELMARHSIDQALLATAAGTAERPTGLRIGLDNPYETEKATLLDRIAAANRCNAIWSRHLGFVTVLGYPADLRAVELLFTSLRVQATRAMLAEGRRQTTSGSSRTRSFRQSFLNAFAIRIGERLNGVTQSGIEKGAADDPGLLPVLAGRRHAVHRLAEELFPDMTYRQRSFHIHDREGWAMGTHAANLAALTAIPSITESKVAEPTTTHPRVQVDAVQDPLFPVPHHI
jgi:hypothetical protein